MTNPTLARADTITVAQTQALLREDPSVRVLDVRTGAEFETSHIPGSYNVPLDTLGEHADDLADVSHPVVLVCQSGGRATKAHGALSDAGKETLHILDGGMAAWQASGADIKHGDSQRWALERQVRLTAGSLALGALLLSVAVPKAKWLAGGVASGLVFSAVTNTCAMGEVLLKLPYNQTDRCDIAGVLESMNEAAA